MYHASPSVLVSLFMTVSVINCRDKRYLAEISTILFGFFLSISTLNCRVGLGSLKSKTDFAYDSRCKTLSSSVGGASRFRAKYLLVSIVCFCTRHL